MARMAAQEARQPILGRKTVRAPSDTETRPVRPHKYGARRITIDGLTFDSQGEAGRWGELVLAERAGFIRNLTRQHTCVLQDGKRNERITLRWDFAYEETVWQGDTPRWVQVVEDFKGVQTPVFRLKLKLHKRVHPDEHVAISTRRGRQAA